MGLPTGRNLRLNAALFTGFEGSRAEVAVVQSRTVPLTEIRSERGERCFRFRLIVGLVG